MEIVGAFLTALFGMSNLVRDDDKCNLLTPLVNTAGEKGRNDEKENSLMFQVLFCHKNAVIFWKTKLVV